MSKCPTPGQKGLVESKRIRARRELLKSGKTVSGEDFLKPVRNDFRTPNAPLMMQISLLRLGEADFSSQGLSPEKRGDFLTKLLVWERQLAGLVGL
jgi:hypothetical protein